MGWIDRRHFAAWIREHGLLLAHSPSPDGHHHVRLPDGTLLYGYLNLRRRDVPPAAIAQIRRRAAALGIALPNPKARTR